MIKSISFLFSRSSSALKTDVDEIWQTTISYCLNCDSNCDIQLTVAPNFYLRETLIKIRSMKICVFFVNRIVTHFYEYYHGTYSLPLYGLRGRSTFTNEILLSTEKSRYLQERFSKNRIWEWRNEFCFSTSMELLRQLFMAGSKYTHLIFLLKTKVNPRTRIPRREMFTSNLCLKLTTLRSIRKASCTPEAQTVLSGTIYWPQTDSSTTTRRKKLKK